MDFGIFNLMGYRTPGLKTEELLLNAVELTKMADEGGMGISWFAEHHFSNYGVCGSPLVMASYCAAQTKRIKLAPGILILPLYSPVRLAGEIAMIHGMSGGRLVLGIGTGYQPFEFQRFGVDLGDAQQMFEECLEIIERGLSDEFVEFRGKHFDLPKTHIAPRPYDSSPDIWVAGNSPQVQSLAARKGFPVMLSAGFESAEQISARRPQYERLLTEAGRDPGELKWGLLNYCCVTDNPAEAREFAENALWQRRAAYSLRHGEERLKGYTVISEKTLPNEHTVDQILENQMIGDVDTCIARGVAQITRTGASHIALYFNVGDYGHQRARRSLERFLGEVMPGIEKELGPLCAIN